MHRSHGSARSSEYSGARSWMMRSAPGSEASEFSGRSAQARVTCLPSESSAQPRPSSDPMASPSGFLCEQIRMRDAARIREIAPSQSGSTLGRATAGVSTAIFGNLQAVDELDHLVALLDAAVEDELQLGDVANGQLIPQSRAQKAGGVLDGAHGLGALLVGAHD